MNEFIIEGKTVAKQRPRRGKHGVFYTPQKTKDYEKKVQWSYLSCRHRTFFYDEPLKATIKIYVKKPRYTKKEYPTTKPDTDNQIKSILDGLNKLAYTDDCQVIDFDVSKRYADRDFVKVKLEEVTKDEKQ